VRLDGPGRPWWQSRKKGTIAARASPRRLLQHPTHPTPLSTIHSISDRVYCAARGKSWLTGRTVFFLPNAQTAIQAAVTKAAAGTGGGGNAKKKSAKQQQVEDVGSGMSLSASYLSGETLDKLEFYEQFDLVVS
jgi:hypothetical protein